MSDRSTSRARRLLLVLTILATVVAVARRRAAAEAHRNLTPPRPPSWPPLEAVPDPHAPSGAPTAEVTPSPTTPAAATALPSTEDRPRWVAPEDGRCPDGFPVKVNARSGIAHVPGGRFYERTVPERCYANVEDALADGYRAAKA